MTKYKKDLANRRAYALLKEESIVGLLGGVILTVVGGAGYFDSSGIVEKLFICLVAVGVFLFLCGLICPPLLYFPNKGLRAFGNLAGKIIFSVLLIAVYVALIVPVGLIFSRKQKNYGIIRWDVAFAISMNSTLAQRDNGNEIDIPDMNGNHGIIHNIFRLLSYFYMNRQYIMIPVLCVLIILGLILFFVSSTIIAPFIYTLF